MNEPNEFIESQDAGQPQILPPEQPIWAKVVAWATIAAGTAYMINPTAGIFELLPDNLPVVGNLDEAAVAFIMFAALRYLGVRLPEFIERWTQTPQLPSGKGDRG